MTARPRGFTLIEVLVALAIVAVTLGAGIKAAGALANNTQRMLDVTSAQWCAENQLTSLALYGLSGGGYPSIGDSDFSCEQLGKTYKGKLIVTRTPNPNFRRVEAQISTEDDQRLVTLSTVRGRF